MNDNDNKKTPVKPRSARSWIAHSKHHTDRIHQLNVKLSGEANQKLREIADQESLKLYEVVEKALAFYWQNHMPDSNDG